MTTGKGFTDRISPPGSWLDTVFLHIHYGLTIIRRDGMAYFFKRAYQLGLWETKAAWQAISLKLSRHGKSRYIKITDLSIDPQQSLKKVPEIQFPLQEDLEQLGAIFSTSNQHESLVQQGITAHNQRLAEREIILEQGRQLFSGKRVLFVSPIRVLGGGANLIFLAAEAMQRMGVEASILNLKVHRMWFSRNYPDLKLQVVFSDIEEIPVIAKDYDAVIATSNPTVEWIIPLADKSLKLAKGYYIQDYEPYFYPTDTHEYQKACASYTLLPNLVRMVTTPWVADQIDLHHHALSKIVGAHMDIDLFRPRPRAEPSWPDRPLRVVAMIRPTTERRNPKITMSILKQASVIYGPRVEFLLFGCELNDPGFTSLEKDFPWRLAGQLRSSQVANLFTEADIFVDFSEFQALGLTALEGMASGLAVIVPAKGGTGVYARHEENCLVVDTANQPACAAALQRLIEDERLRLKLQSNAISAAAGFFPELPAFNMLYALFKEN